jgi:transcriptional regulator with XRE-family HTH domain
MPSKAPALSSPVAAQLQALGERIRAYRAQQKVSATSAAQAAGMSRVTLHRIERGEPSVTMGAYLGAAAALGLQLELKAPVAAVPLPALVRLADFPELQRLAWQTPGLEALTPQQALNLYERNWRHVDQARMQPAEHALVQALVASLGEGRLLV